MTVQDDDHRFVGNGLAVDSFFITVNNVSPVATGVNRTFVVGDTAFSKLVATYTDVGAADSHRATINWGDGSPVQGPFFVSGGQVKGTHTYTKARLGATGYPKQRTIKITVTDDDGGFHRVEAIATIVDRKIPTVDVGFDKTTNEGINVGFSGATFRPVPVLGGTVTDTSLNYKVTWDFGDGTVVGPVPVGSFAASVTLVSLSQQINTYDDDGQYVVALTIEAFKASGALLTAKDDTLIVTVNNTRPSVNAGGNRTINEGGGVSLPPASFTDPGRLDTHTATVNWGDGTTEPGLVSQGLGSGSVFGSHVYADNGFYAVTVTVTDKDGGAGTSTFFVTVNNAKPSVNAGGNRTINEGGSVSLPPAGFADPGSLDTHTATINWGDGTFVVGRGQPANAQGLRLPYLYRQRRVHRDRDRHRR